MKKVTVFGGTNAKNYTKDIQNKCSVLGKYIASQNAEILTGACLGFPYFVAKAAIAQGGQVTGYSPAKNLKEHIELYKFPTDGTTNLVFEDHTEAPFLKRSLDMMPFSDVVIAMGGSWGTYVELVFSLFYKKDIILITEFGGAVEQFIDSYNFFGSRDYNPVVHEGAKLHIVETVEQAINKLGELLK